MAGEGQALVLMRIPRDLKPIIKACKEQGWEVTTAKGNKSMHLRFLSPDPNVKPVFFSSSPSDHRASLNLRAELRRSGLKLD